MVRQSNSSGQYYGKIKLPGSCVLKGTDGPINMIMPILEPLNKG